MKTFHYLTLTMMGLALTSEVALANTSAVKVIEYGVNSAQQTETARAQQSAKLQDIAPKTLPRLSRTEMQTVISGDATDAVKRKVGPQKVSSPTRHSYYHEFSFYDVQTYLLDDINYDGFYHAFSLNIDADVYGAAATEDVPVYAVIYTSRNGGDWQLLHTTDVFYLQGNSSFDSYEVTTSLDSGFPTDYYDVLIDLYEVGYDDVVATISSDDLNSLYALPLQSYDRDVDSYSEEVVVSGGSLAWMPLLALGLLGWSRRKVS